MKPSRYYNHFCSLQIKKIRFFRHLKFHLLWLECSVKTRKQVMSIIWFTWKSELVLRKNLESDFLLWEVGNNTTSFFRPAVFRNCCLLGDHSIAGPHLRETTVNYTLYSHRILSSDNSFPYRNLRDCPVHQCPWKHYSKKIWGKKKRQSGIKE